MIDNLEYRFRRAHDGTEPEPFEARPTTFRRVFAPLAAAALVAAVLIAVLMGVA